MFKGVADRLDCGPCSSAGLIASHFRLNSHRLAAVSFSFQGPSATRKRASSAEAVCSSERALLSVASARECWPSAFRISSSSGSSGNEDRPSGFLVPGPSAFPAMCVCHFLLASCLPPSDRARSRDFLASSSALSHNLSLSVLPSTASCIAGNIRALQRVHRAVERYWRKMLSSRSWQGQVWWKKFQQIKERFPLLRPKLYLPYSELQAIATL